MTPGRIAVAVSGEGSNLRALVAAERRGGLGGKIVVVVADRDCPALEFAEEEGIATAVVRPADHPDRAAWDAALTLALAAGHPDLVVLAGFMRVIGPETLARFKGRILNVHPALLPAFPGRESIRETLEAGVRVTGVTVHYVDETLDGGPIVAQETVPVLPGDSLDSLAARVHAVEHRLLPQCVALAMAGALSTDGRHVSIDAEAAADVATPRRALLSVYDKTGIVKLARGLAELGFQLVSTGRTAGTLRDTGLEVTDVSAVTGFPEMLDGRVKTLHPRISAGLLADLRLADHRAQLAAAAIEPFELVVSNLYPFAEEIAKSGATDDDVIEQIDVGGPTMVRAAAKNHASVAIVTDPGDYDALLAELRSNGKFSDETRRALAVQAFALTARYDTLIARELGRRLLPDEAAATLRDTDGAPALPPTLDLHLELAERLRYGENPHQAAALYRVPGTPAVNGPFAAGADPLQGKALSYNNLLDAAAAVNLARDLRGNAVVIMKHGNPCGAAEAADLRSAWDAALAGDPVSAFGGVVAVRGAVDPGLAGCLASLFLEVVVAASFEADALVLLAAKPNLRLLTDASLLSPPVVTLELRTAGGGVLATQSDSLPDDLATWRPVTSRAPTPAELTDLDFAWRVARRVVSNAIVLVRDRAVIGVGAGQMSRVDSARLAVEKAGQERVRGAVCASDAFYPFPDGLEVCAAAGVTAFVQPGGSKSDADVIAAADRAGAAMVFTGVRHFRH
jgi:phosphoribosylaminoimidazolecarboxamide formyltransferase/IMP cyclohydrolase